MNLQIRNSTFLITLIALLGCLASYANAASEDTRTKHYNLNKKKLAISGYDPVAYFDDAPTKGSEDIQTAHNGVLYYFSSESNKSKFLEEPAKYEPAYGGWCAWAMAEDGSKVKINPKSYKIIDGQNFLFYHTFLANTRKSWDEKASKVKEATLVANADAFWEKALSEKE